MVKKIKVFVGMSGGVDSSVSVALLKEAGYDVTGVFIQVWQPDFIECSRGDDRREAMRVAARLGIPFLTFNFEKEYKEDVVDYMIHEYKDGRTPNPDVMCNQQIKFGAFLKKAREMGADYIATGHYARVRPTTDDRQQITENSERKTSSVVGCELLVGIDKNKDQSYFLWTLTQDILKYVMFPVGDYTKPQVREMARKFELPNAERRESQGLCFMGKFKMVDFLSHFIPRKKGNVLNEKGEIIGTHKGAFYYTVGQRHGFIVTKKGTNDPPLYVASKDIEKNTITVTPYAHPFRVAPKSGVREIQISDVNYIRGKNPKQRKMYMARVRYRQPLQKVTYLPAPKLRSAGNTQHIAHHTQDIKHKILFEESQIVALGQSLVLYDGEECLGGGVISSVKQRK